ncbi:MAG TPA: PE-PPE domain-containing protein, partial [Mycobacterium sp.]|nr:PE-PPE domain-containing protein [Mycobacterium sp.]
INWGYGNPGAAVHTAFGAGPWAVNASGELATGSGLAGFLPMMDPLQVFAGIQDAGIHSFLDPVNQILGFAGLDPLPGWFDDALHVTFDLTNTIDQFLLAGWADLVDLLQDAFNGLGLTALDLMSILGPDAIFSGLPLISAEPVIDAVGLVFNIFNFFGA